MGWWKVAADTLAMSRFVVSPLAETIASLKALDRGTAAHSGERQWLDTHRTAYRRQLAADPITELLVRAALGRTWNADFLTPAPADKDGSSFEIEAARVRGTSAETARADLAVSLGGTVPEQLNRNDLPARAADLLEWVWTESVLPYWDRRRQVIEADVVARTSQLSHGGWAAALGDMRPGMRWLGDGRLQINSYSHPPRELAGPGLMFVPVTPRYGWVSWDASDRYTVVFPCSGVLAETDEGSVPNSLGALLGHARAAILVLLDTPKSTTQLAILTGQALGSVGRHLKVLLDARLVRRRRAGRSVLYYRTDSGNTLLEAQKQAQ